MPSSVNSDPLLDAASILCDEEVGWEVDCDWEAMELGNICDSEREVADRAAVRWKLVEDLTWLLVAMLGYAPLASRQFNAN